MEHWGQGSSALARSINGVRIDSVDRVASLQRGVRNSEHVDLSSVRKIPQPHIKSSNIASTSRSVLQTSQLATFRTPRLMVSLSNSCLAMSAQLLLYLTLARKVHIERLANCPAINVLMQY